MPPEFATIALSLIAAAFWGSGDFTGGITTKRVDVFGVVIVSHFAGLLLLVILALLANETPLPLDDVLWSMAAGIMGSIGIAALYYGLSVGRMGVVAPVTGVVGTALTVIFTAATIGLPTLVQMIGFGLALVSVWMLSATAHTAHTGNSGITYALIAAFGFGSFGILLDQVDSEAFFWVLAASRGASFSFMLLVATLNRRQWMPQRPHIPAVLVVGMLDLMGNGFYELALQAGRLDVAAVLSSLYPAVTVLLAWVVLRESLGRLQLLGILTALVAIVLVAV